MSYSGRKNCWTGGSKDVFFDEYIGSLHHSAKKPVKGYRKSFYELLEVTPNCSLQVIKSSYKRLLLKTHPDKGGSAEIFNLVARAYMILANPEARQIYDNYGQAAAETYIDLQV